jgi:hypothetical protein
VLNHKIKAKMQLEDRRKKTFASFMEQMRNIEIKSAQLTTAKDRVNISFSDGTRALLYLSSVKGGFGKGEFGVYIGLSIFDGPIYRILKDTRLDGGSSFPKDMIFRATSHSFKAGRGIYKFRASIDDDALVKKMIRDVRRVFVPIIAIFTSNYAEAVDFILDNDGRHLRKPFAMCVILLVLGNGFNQLDKVIARAKKVDGYWDFHRSKDPENLIVQRIQKWFEKNK